MAIVKSVNVGGAEPNPYKESLSTGINKQPQAMAVEVRAPGSHESAGSGLVGDFIGDTKHHGGDEQAVYAFESEDLDRWRSRLERDVPNGFFGENLTTFGLDISGARLGEIWRIGTDVELRVTGPRLPCKTFRGWVGEVGWAKAFTADARPGAYLSVVKPGFVAAGDSITVVHRPLHAVTMSMTFQALTTHRDLLPQLLAAGNDLSAELRELAVGGRGIRLD